MLYKIKNLKRQLNTFIKRILQQLEEFFLQWQPKMSFKIILEQRIGADLCSILMTVDNINFESTDFVVRI